MRKNILSLIIVLNMVMVFLFVSCAKNDYEPGQVKDTYLSKNDLDSFRLLYNRFLLGDINEYDIELLDKYILQILYASEFDLNISKDIREYITSFNNEYPNITLFEIKSSDFSSKLFYDFSNLLKYIISGGAIDNSNKVIQLGVTQFNVSGYIDPAVSGSRLVANYYTSTSCVWWYIQRIDNIVPNDSGYYELAKRYTAPLFCTPQIKNFSVSWHYDFNGTDISTGANTVFTWQQGGSRHYKYNLPLIQNKPIGAIPLAGGYLPNRDAGIINVHLSSGDVRGSAYDIDHAVEIYIDIFSKYPSDELQCVIEWGDDADIFDCSGNTNVYRIGPFKHFYSETGKYAVKVRLKKGSEWSISPYVKEINVDDFYELQLTGGEGLIQYGNTYSFNYSISDYKHNLPYQCKYIAYLQVLGLSSKRVLLNTDWTPCSYSGSSPVFKIAWPEILGGDLMLVMQVDTKNALGVEKTARIRLQVDPPVTAEIMEFEVTPGIIDSGDTVLVNFAADSGGTVGGVRINCELEVDDQVVFSSTGWGCYRANNPVVVALTNTTNHTKYYSVKLTAWTDYIYPDGAHFHSEATSSDRIAVRPEPAVVYGECYVQSRAGGSYDRKVYCEISPNGEMPPGTYSFKATSSYTCPTLVRTVQPGDNLIRFNCRR